MPHLYATPPRRRRNTLLVTIGFALAWLFSDTATAQQAPFALLERATLTASGNTINAIQVPVVLASGVTVYVNISMQFVADFTGNLTLAAGFPQVSRSPILLTGSFVAGRYSSAGAPFDVAGPGVLDGGITQWSIASGATRCTASGTWYTGPIATNPIAVRLRSAAITSTAWSYGIGSNIGCGFSNWPSNGIVGVSQVGSTLSIASFSDTQGRDFNTPQAQLTFSLAP